MIFEYSGDWYAADQIQAVVFDYKDRTSMTVLLRGREGSITYRRKSEEEAKAAAREFAQLWQTSLIGFGNPPPVR